MNKVSIWWLENIFHNSVFVALISDTYVKLTLMSPTGQEVARSKTSIRRGQPNPLFKEAFMFQVALFQLAEVTLMVSVYNKRSMKKKDMIGWFALGKGFPYICIFIQYGYVLKGLYNHVHALYDKTLFEEKIGNQTFDDDDDVFL